MNKSDDIATTNKANSKTTSNPIATPQPIQQRLASSGRGSDNTDVGSSWATTISHYLLQRRQQTQSAYQAQLKPDAQVADNHQEWLFEAIFAVLAQRLEEGHTVLMLESEAINSDLHSKNSYVGLHPWQQQLLQPLLQPLLVQVEVALNEVATGELLLQAESTLWRKSLLQSDVSEYDQQILQQRYDTCIALYQLMQQLAQDCNPSINSLSKFIKLVNKQPLFSQAKKENDSPVVFQVEKELDDESIKLTLWLHRTWQAEYALAENIIRIKQQRVNTLPVTLNPLLNHEQQAAIHTANKSAFSIITGGPGTGKTFTVAQLVIALQQAQTSDRAGDTAIDDAVDNNKALALAAPTGKAAQRMQESLQDAIQQAGIEMQLPEAKTIHRLLGIGRGRQPRYNRDNPLSEDIIIVDEASMLGVELANHLVSAIKPNARLILLGDANQLAAVDAGAVLADLCRISVLQDISQRLTISRRFTEDSGIGQLARFINQGHKSMTEVWQLLERDKALNFYHLENLVQQDRDNKEIGVKNSLSNCKFLNILEQNYKDYTIKSENSLKTASKAKHVPIEKNLDDFNVLISLLNQFRVLTAGHHGHCGDHHINRYLSEQHKAKLKLPLSKSPWYHGRPVMILQNNYELGLFNGDIGICMQTQRGQLQVFFENKAQGIAINMFGDEMVATAYAMTIHKSQGSEFDHVAISFDDNNGRLLSQELIYTAVTRAKKQISVFSTASAFNSALNTPTVRQTGLGLQFDQLL